MCCAVLDIKPYLPFCDALPEARAPPWVRLTRSARLEHTSAVCSAEQQDVPALLQCAAGGQRLTRCVSQRRCTRMFDDTCPCPHAPCSPQCIVD